ncbi:pH-response regulator protein palC [Ophiocordyceps camponoti-floridani]|uniref:pH-response regulator protein palC n=1 Tax=Ophiocordyceps camponoti-floridani TaxID=2030778 RepID=A0A8H4Q362_9HYPO|nr:pH-response regulator protein palC [Ophiocordyceps camponoti-floridani]
MPFPFVLPTTSSFSFSSSFSCDSHPSLCHSASAQRGVVRDALRRHKRLPPSSRAASLSNVISSIDGYLPYLFAVDSGFGSETLVGGESINVVLNKAPSIQWRPTLSGDIVPGRERRRISISSLEYEIFFVLSTLAFAYISVARSILQPLHVTTGDFVGAKDRTTAIQTANKHLLDAAAIYEYLADRSEQIATAPPCVDVAPTTARALASLAMAEATLLAVTKDDPYPAVVAQSRNKNDKEWMFKSADMPKPKAHLNARLCLAASDHATKAGSLLQQQAGSGVNKASSGLTRYVDDLRSTCRAKACRFFGIHAEMDGHVAEGIGWLRAGLHALDIDVKDRESSKGLGFSKLRKGLAEKREDRRVEKETAWGADAGRLEETRVLEMLEAKWNKINDTMNTQVIPPLNSLLAKMPSGREIFTPQPYKPSTLSRDALEAMRCLPEGQEDGADGHEASSDDEPSGPSVIGGYPECEAGQTPSGIAYY